ncbi:MAG: SIMPL domain-containing protein [Treponema sp.]|nr:SIMPL domain-containing protein [Treponema sp.]
MKITSKFIFIALFSGIMLSSCYIQKEKEEKNSIYVTGTGTAVASPDSATVDFAIVTTGWSAKSIVTDNDTLTNRLVESVKNVGINPDDIQFSECNVTMPASQYEARRSLRVTVRNVKLVPAVVDCKLPGSQVRLGKIDYSVNDNANLVRRARTAAMQNAQDTASLLSGASGCKIGLPSLICEAEPTETCLTADGKVSVKATVSVTYDLQ